MADKRNRKEYHREWQQKFKEEHGISYSTYRQRLQVAKVITEYETAGNPKKEVK